MKLKSFLIGLFAFCSASIFAQTPCVDGMAGDYPCDGFDLQSHMSLDDLGITANGNDIWGWTDPEFGNEYVLMGGNNRTVFVDITDPVNPIFVGFVETATGSSLWRDVKVIDHYAVIVSEAGGHGLQVFDLTRLRDAVDMPVDFAPDAVNNDFGSAHNIAVNDETNYAYVIGADTYEGGPHFIDLTDPLNPVTAGGFSEDGYTHDCQIITYWGPDEEYHGREIIFASNENSLTIIDATEKTNPVMLSRMEYEESFYTHQCWLSIDQSTIYMNDELDESNLGVNTKTFVIDVNDLDNPSVEHIYFGETSAIDHNLYVRGDLIYESNYTSGLRVLQQTDVPEAPLDEVGYFDVHPGDDNATFSGTWSNYPYFESNNIAVSSMELGLFILHSPTIIPADIDAPGPDAVEEISIDQFSIYPNPTDDVLNVAFSDNVRAEYWTITDLSGRVVLTGSNGMNHQLTQIDVSDISSGAYLLSINGSQAVQQFMKK